MRSVDELGALGRALNMMMARLREKIGDLEEERAKARAILDGMVEGVIAADPRGRTVTANSAARRLLGYGPGTSPLPDLPELFRVKAAREVVLAVLRGSSCRTASSRWTAASSS